MAELTSSTEEIEFQDLFTRRRTLRRWLEVSGWITMSLLLLVAYASVIARMIFMGEAQSVADPEAVYNDFDIRYVQLALASWLHLLPALVIAVTGPLQFIRTIRKRWPGWHRVSGRLYIVTGFIGAASGFVIGGLNPFLGLDGPGFNEAMATTVFAAFIMWALYSAYAAVRRRDFVRHREWMVRSWSLMMAIATERILLGIFQATTDIDMGILFGATFWMAGVINVAAAEVWIHLTRTPGRGVRHWKDLDQST